MSQPTSNLGGIVAGVLTAVVETASPGLVEKAQTITQHSFNTFTSHNPGLAEVGAQLLAFAEQQANTHGFGMVSDVLNGLISVLAQAPSNVTVVAPAAAPEPAPSTT